MAIDPKASANNTLIQEKMSIGISAMLMLLCHQA
jgi:hypothetical protein